MPAKTKTSKRQLTTDDFKRISWRSIGPAIMGGRVSCLCFEPGNAKTFYVGYATGGLWKTTNLGITFAPIFDDKETASIGAVACCDAPLNWPGWTPEEKKLAKTEKAAKAKGKIVWVGTGEGNGRNSSSWGHGVYRSTDSGSTFEFCGLAETHDIPSLAVDPRDPDTCYIAALGRLWGPNPERGVYKTTDGGKTWSHVLKLADHGCCEVHVDPKNPETVYAAMYKRRRAAHSFSGGSKEGGIFRSQDGGKTWKKLTKGLPKVTGRIGMDVFESNPQVLYAVVESNEGGGADIRDDRSRVGGVFRSEDGGDSWVRQSVRTPRAFYFSRIYVDPVDDQRVYLPGWYIELSEDGGKTFRQGVGEKIHVDQHALIINPADPKHLVAGNDGGVYQSFDGGEKWQFLDTMAVGQFYNIAVDMSEPYRVAGGLQDNGTWVGPSASFFESGKERDGTPNTALTNRDWKFVLWGDGFHAAFDPTDPNTIYAEWQGGNLTRVDYKNVKQVDIAPRPQEGRRRFRFNWNSPFFVSHHDPKRLYLGGNYVFRLDDRGAKWEQISGDLTTADVAKIESVGSVAETHCTVVTLAESPLSEGTLWAGSDDGLVHVTTDDGKKWTAVTPKGVNGLYVSRIEAGHMSPKTAYVTVDGHRSNDFKPRLFVTDDLGKTWTEITGNLPPGHPAKVIREDLRNPNVLYVGTEQGIFVTLDRGKKWVKLNGKSLPTVPVDDIVQHPRDLDLIIGTHGRSIYILDDASFFGEASPEVLDAEFHLFPIRPARPKRFLSNGGFWTDQIFRAVNPPMGATIHYWIREFTGDDVKFSIKDSKGKEVAKLDGTNAPGFNRVVWDLLRFEWMRLNDKGEELGEPVFAPPGEYKVEASYGKRKASQPLQVLEVLLPG